NAPDVGEDEGELGAKTPSVLAKTEGAIKKTPDNFTYLDPADFPKLFAPDLPRRRNSSRALRCSRRPACLTRPRLLAPGKRSRAGESSPGTTRSLIPISSAGTTSAPRVTQRRLRARATRCTSLTRKRSRP